MPRDLSIGNGNILIAFDKDGLLREFFFPYVGEENHTKGNRFRFGVWIEGQFSWIGEGWQIQRDYLDDALVSQVEYFHPHLALKIVANDLVDFHENLYLKKLSVENLSSQEREIRLFLAQDFDLYGNRIGDTAEFRPEVGGILHYKNERYFLVNFSSEVLQPIAFYATGKKGVNGLEGTWKDAEDGVLSQNPIAQGAVDSVVGMHLSLQAKEKKNSFYWICCGKNWEEVKELHRKVKKRGGEFFFHRTVHYWHLWANKNPLNDALLTKKVLRLYKRSLLIIRSQINSCGSILAGADSDVAAFNQDTYSYMWPRDAALTAYALDLAGYGELSANFYRFCSHLIERQGYFLHKYTPSGFPASSWHPWIEANHPQLPIQEDETALVLWSLWQHYQMYKDIELIRPLYHALIKPAADFLMSYRDPDTKLPLPSYDLWEERRGVFTFTVSTVYGGLISAAEFMHAFGDTALAEEYREGAKQMREAMDRHLYLEKEKRFARGIHWDQEGKPVVDTTIDASLYAIFAFGAYDPHDEKVKTTMEQIEAKLWRKEQGGGLARYDGDSYYRVSPQDIGNPWFVTTLWLAQYQIAIANNKQQLERALTILNWVADHALPSGTLAEQIHPFTHEPLSISPLTWSHATYLIAVQEYLNRLTQIEKCPTCGLPKSPKTVSA